MLVFQQMMGKTSRTDNITSRGDRSQGKSRDEDGSGMEQMKRIKAIRADDVSVEALTVLQWTRIEWLRVAFLWKSHEDRTDAR